VCVCVCGLTRGHLHAAPDSNEHDPGQVMLLKPATNHTHSIPVLYCITNPYVHQPECPFLTPNASNTPMLLISTCTHTHQRTHTHTHKAILFHPRADQPSVGQVEWLQCALLLHESLPGFLCCCLLLCSLLRARLQLTHAHSQDTRARAHDVMIRRVITPWSGHEMAR